MMVVKQFAGVRVTTRSKAVNKRGAYRSGTRPDNVHPVQMPDAGYQNGTEAARRIQARAREVSVEPHDNSDNADYRKRCPPHYSTAAEHFKHNSSQHKCGYYFRSESQRNCDIVAGLIEGIAYSNCETAECLLSAPGANRSTCHLRSNVREQIVDMHSFLRKKAQGDRGIEVCSRESAQWSHRHKTASTSQYKSREEQPHTH